ncbi:hypothetical protein ACSFA3_19540 [Variovorax sp. RHLX14]|uniref:hypothetical protein n=1 Tax=Variovorax sp. RHLX14 TaxID=1259731 RepID=UPI003F480A04
MSQVNEFNEISWRIMRLSREANEQGLAADATRLVELAADVELLSDDLQMCWGGPLNGQSGRKAIFEQILGVSKFDGILETGTFRGITTEWLAEHYAGPIATCELEKLYLLQAQNRLSKYSNVTLSLLDSREFLTRSLDNTAHDDQLFIYLDAHWKDDLPLARELEIIDQSGVKAIIAIDDFRVPGDPGYKYDDYGPGRALTIDLIEFLKTKGYRIYFPALPSNLEDGSKSGVCVLTRLMIQELDACDLLRGGDWRDWRIVELDVLLREALGKAEKYDVLLAEQATELPIADSEPEIEAEIKPALEPVPVDDGSAEWIPIAEGFIRKLSPHLQADAYLRFVPDIALLLARHQEFESLLERLATHADRTDEDSRERLEVGRALVEERAHALQLVRQIHHLRERLHETEGEPKSVGLHSSSLRFVQTLPSYDKEVVLRIIGELKNSRGLKMLSHLAPSARLNILRLESEITKPGLQNL